MRLTLQAPRTQSIPVTHGLCVRKFAYSPDRFVTPRSMLAAVHGRSRTRAEKQVIRVAPHALNGGRSRHVLAPVSAPTAFAGAPSQSSCCHSCTFFVLFCWYKMRPPPQGSAKVLSGVPKRRKAGMSLVRKIDVR